MYNRLNCSQSCVVLLLYVFLRFIDTTTTVQLTEERISNKIVNVGEQMDQNFFFFYLCVELSVSESI